MKICRTLALLLFFISTPLYAQQTADKNSSPPSLVKIVQHTSFGPPIDCRIGEDCWVMNYVDMKPDDGQNTDPACFNRTYDAHKGTDFAILDEAAMKRGVSVLAAMDGTIEKTRDSEPDRWATDEQLQQVKKDRKECGNAIMIDHGEGLQTIYCHLKQNSVTVKPGQKVKKGDVLGQVGLTGFTQFPHVHFGILSKGVIIDPFTTRKNTSECGQTDKNLWDNNLGLDYQPLSIQEAGFSGTIPDMKTIELDAAQPATLALNADLMAFWVVLLGAREGDFIKLEIKDPDGNVFAEREITQDNTRARQFYYAGRKNNDGLLKEGGYTGTVTVTRENDAGEQQEWIKVKAILMIAS